VDEQRGGASEQVTQTSQDERQKSVFITQRKLWHTHQKGRRGRLHLRACPAGS
jgi:hypothetical protein